MFTFGLRHYTRHTSRKFNFLLKAGVHLKPVFPLLNLGLMRISRLRFKQSRNSMLVSQSYDKRCFVNFLVIFGDVWKEIVFLKGLVKFGEIRNIKDLM